MFPIQKTWTSVLKLIAIAILLFLFVFGLLHIRTGLLWYYNAALTFLVVTVLLVLLQLSKSCRCIMAISTVKMMGPQCRYILLSIVSGILIGGPLVSIVYNLNEVHRAVQCSASLVREQTEEIQKVYKAGYNDISDAIKESILVWQDIGGLVDRAIGPIRNGFEKAQNSLRTANEVMGRAKENCRSTIDGAVEDCKSGIDNAYDECVRKVPSSETALKRPLQNIGNSADSLGNVITGGVQEIGNSFTSIFGRRRRRSIPSDLQYICNIIKVDGICSPLMNSRSLCAPLEAKIIPLVSTITDNIGQLSEVFRLSVTPMQEATGEITQDLGNVTEEFKELQDDFREKFECFQFIISIVEHLPTIFLLITIPITSYLYLHRYHTAVQNNKVEKFFSKDAKKESKEIPMQIVLILIHFLLSMLLFAFDFLLYFTQKTTEIYGAAIFNATGSLKVKLDIEVGRVFRPVVDRFINGLEKEHNYEFSVSTAKCLPKPKKNVGSLLVILVGVLYFLMILSIILQRCVGTMKKKIVTGYYPVSTNITDKKEKKKLKLDGY